MRFAEGAGGGIIASVLLLIFFPLATGYFVFWTFKSYHIAHKEYESLLKRCSKEQMDRIGKTRFQYVWWRMSDNAGMAFWSLVFRVVLFAFLLFE